MSAQLTDENVKLIQEVLSKPPETDYEKQIYKNYALRNGRVYRITVRGLLWVVPSGMRKRIVRAAQDVMGHFSLERDFRFTLQPLLVPQNKEVRTEIYI